MGRKIRVIASNAHYQQSTTVNLYVNGELIDRVSGTGTGEFDEVELPDGVMEFSAALRNDDLTSFSRWGTSPGLDYGVYQDPTKPECTFVFKPVASSDVEGIYVVYR